jgi:large subunit ribosomal protein L19
MERKVMINLENNNLDYFVGDPEDSDIESYMAMPEEGEDVTTEKTSEDVKVEETEVETDNTSETATEEPEIKEEKDVDEPSEEVSEESDAVEETSEDVKVEEIEVETENTSETATEEPEVKEEKNVDEPSEEVSEESDAVEEVAETEDVLEKVEESVEPVDEKTDEETTPEAEDSPAPIEMDPEEAAHLAMQTKIVQATYGDIRKDLPQFHSGDTISVGYRVIEGSRSRVQIFEGVVIKISAGHGLDKTFTVRKISGGIGVERIFPFHSPNIESVKVLKEGKVRRAKLYYLRGLKGKATRIKDRIK